MIIIRYIFIKCMVNTLLILCAFVGLFAIFMAIGELSSVGHGDFNTLSLFIYIIALLPSFTYLLIPLAVLIGVVLTILNLVHHSEYTIIRTSGVSLKFIALILLLFGFTFGTLSFFVGEILAPRTDNFAKIYKLKKLNQIITADLSSGVWTKDGAYTFVNIKHILPNDTIGDIYIFYYSNELKLLKSIHALDGNFDLTKNVWQLHTVETNEYRDNANIVIKKFNVLEWRSSISPKYFSVLVVTPESMSIFELMKYINHLHNNNQSVHRYEIAFWSKLTYPFSAIVLALIAILFIPNNARMVNLSNRIFIVILIGAAFFFIIKLINYLALLLALNAIVATTLPIILLLSITIYYLYRFD